MVVGWLVGLFVGLHYHGAFREELFSFLRSLGLLGLGICIIGVEGKGCYYDWL